MGINKLNKTFVAEQVLTAEEMNAVAGKIDELVEATNRAPVSGETVQKVASEAAKETVMQEVGGMNPQQLGYATAMRIDNLEMPTVCGYPFIRFADKAPDIVPDFPGQVYIDQTAKKIYMAVDCQNAGSYKVLN